MDLLDILSFTSILKLQSLKFAHRGHSKALPNTFDNYFQYANHTQSYNTRYARNERILYAVHKNQLWKTICKTISLKNLSTFTFPVKIK